MQKATARRAMTLVELMAASALAAVLLSASFGVIGSLAAQRKTQTCDGYTEPWRKQLSEQLRWEIANARKMCATPTELRLVGYCSTDFVTDEATHRPCEIIYSIHNDGSRSWLIRREIHLDSGTLKNSRTELAAAGITRIDAFDPKARNNARREDRRKRNQPRIYMPVPDRLQLTLYGENEEVALINELVVLQ